MSRMKVRVNVALDQWYIKPWSLCINASRWKHACRVKMTEPTKWGNLACKWLPNYVFDLWYDCLFHNNVFQKLYGNAETLYVDTKAPSSLSLAAALFAKFLRK